MIHKVGGCEFKDQVSLTFPLRAHAPTAWFLPVGLQVPLPEELKDIAT